MMNEIKIQLNKLLDTMQMKSDYDKYRKEYESLLEIMRHEIQKAYSEGYQEGKNDIINAS